VSSSERRIGELLWGKGRFVFELGLLLGIQLVERGSGDRGRGETENRRHLHLSGIHTQEGS
jgi:hypothetical protein